MKKRWLEPFRKLLHKPKTLTTMFDFTEIFCVIDDFFKKFEPIYWQFLKQENKRKRIRLATLSLSEIVTIAICYKTSQVNNFKTFFQLLYQFESKLFKSLPCYKNMLSLINQHQLAIHALHRALSKGQACQYLWIDSTPLPVCKNKRIPRGHHALEDIASRGKSSIDWFYGCKLHLLMNSEGQIVKTVLSTGHIADIIKIEELVDGLLATVYGDRGYIGKSIKTKLLEQDIDLITYPRKNMRVSLLPFSDEYHLRQRKKIETLIGLLKEKYHLVSSKHRTISGFLAGSAEFDVHQNQIIDWKNQLISASSQAFDQSKAPTEPPIDLKKLHAKIGEQALEIDFLEGVLKKLGRFNHKS